MEIRQNEKKDAAPRLVLLLTLEPEEQTRWFTNLSFVNPVFYQLCKLYDGIVSFLIAEGAISPFHFCLEIKICKT
jgi:hypothetical protein